MGGAILALVLELQSPPADWRGRPPGGWNGSLVVVQGPTAVFASPQPHVQMAALLARVRPALNAHGISVVESAGKHFSWGDGTVGGVLHLNPTEESTGVIFFSNRRRPEILRGVAECLDFVSRARRYFELPGILSDSICNAPDLPRQTHPTPQAGPPSPEARPDPP
jgi:hypothetical protein